MTSPPAPPGETPSGNVVKPNKILERRLAEAIMGSLHDLLPEFRTHVGSCPGCGGFHDWLRWRHVEGTNRWVAECPEGGHELSLPFQFAPKGGE